MLGGLLILPFAHPSGALSFYDRFSAEAPDQLGLLAGLATLADGTSGAYRRCS